MVLSLFNEKSSSEFITRTLDFLGIEFDSKPHPFWGVDRDETKNIRLMIPGIIFRDYSAQAIFATRLRLPPEIESFLAQKDFRILRLPIF